MSFSRHSELRNDSHQMSTRRYQFTLQVGIRGTSVAIELDQPLVADPEVMRNLMEHDMPDLTA
jgi:hypothetical protein